MNTTVQLHAKNNGFTLIELLIVIALLGALAVGLLATIDPFEQLKKGRDTSLRNTVSEFYNANLRYYSVKGSFAWGTASTWTTPITVNDLGNNLTELVNSGELKSRFVELAGTTNLGKIYLTSTAPDALTVCFQPESKSFQKDPNTIYGRDGMTTSVTGGVCKSQTSVGGVDCNFCIQ